MIRRRVDWPKRMLAGPGRRGVRACLKEHFFSTSIGPIVPGRYLAWTTPSSRL